MPGDIVPGHQNPEIERLRRAASVRSKNAQNGRTVHDTNGLTRQYRNDDRMYLEDIENQNRHFDFTEMDSMRRHELERGSDGVLRNFDQQRFTDAEIEARRAREQLFYRDGNAEVLQLVSRGELEDQMVKFFG